jgi:hypothetical protein
MNVARCGDFLFWMAFVVSELVVLHHASIAILTFGRPEVHTYVYSMYYSLISKDHKKVVYLRVFRPFSDVIRRKPLYLLGSLKTKSRCSSTDPKPRLDNLLIVTSQPHFTQNDGPWGVEA